MWGFGAIVVQFAHFKLADDQHLIHESADDAPWLSDRQPDRLSQAVWPCVFLVLR